MPFIPFPNVPNVPGVPSILRNTTVPSSAGQLVNMALDMLQQAIFKWGVYDKAGKKMLDPDSFLSIDFKNESRVSDYPQEAGAFASYNKVNTPYDCRVRMALGGDKQSRTKFLGIIEGMLKSIDLYTVITPEVTYRDAALQNYDYRRESKNGTTMLTVDLWFIEVRQTAIAQFKETKEPAGADPVSDGQAQAFPVDTSDGIVMTQGVSTTDSITMTPLAPL